MEWRSLRAEVAAAAQVHERTAQSLLDLARALLHRFPDTLDSLRHGSLTPRHARILVEQATGLPVELSAIYEARLLPFAEKLVPPRFETFFVGCTRAAKYCDVDHTVPWIEAGETIASNLAQLCRGHHRVKGGTRWKVGHDPGGTGVLTWTSPTGRVYTNEPATKLPPPRQRGPMVSKLLAQTAWADDPPEWSSAPF